MITFELDPATSIGLTRLAVSDTRRSLGFYRDVLGFVAEPQADGVTLLKAGDRALLALEERPGARPRPPRSTGLYHVALLLPGRADLARVLRRFAEVRYPLSGASDHAVSEALYLDDPDGNGLEIYADRPRAAWPAPGGNLRMTVDPLDVDGIIGELERDPAPWAGMPVGSTVGHIHLHVSDLHAAEDFYCGLLGFSVMQRFGASALFVSAGGYHHHLGLNTWAGVGAPPPPPDATGLVRFRVDLPGRAAWSAMLAQLEQARAPIAERGDGWLRIFDPSRNLVEIGAAA